MENENNTKPIEREYSKFQIYLTGFILILVSIGALYISTSTLVALINHKVAITSDYQYAKIAPFTIEPTFFYLMIMCGVVYSFLVLTTIFSWINRVSWSKTIIYTILSLIPVGVIAYQYQTTDEFMYEPISQLYESSAKSNPNFSKSPIGLRFSKALVSHDYSSLKEISNNLDALKLMDFKSNKIVEIVNLLPLPQSVAAFKKMMTDTSGFVSLADYKAFYNTLLVEFKASDAVNKKEFIFLVDLIHPDRYYIPAP